MDLASSEWLGSTVRLKRRKWATMPCNFWPRASAASRSAHKDVAATCTAADVDGTGDRAKAGHGGPTNRLKLSSSHAVDRRSEHRSLCL